MLNVYFLFQDQFEIIVFVVCDPAPPCEYLFTGQRILEQIKCCKMFAFSYAELLLTLGFPRPDLLAM